MSGIECGYGGGKVFDGVSMTVERGEIVALIDRNGVGKTTLMRALIGLVQLSGRLFSGAAMVDVCSRSFTLVTIRPLPHDVAAGSDAFSDS